MAVLSELQIDILSNFGSTYITIGEVVFKNPLGDVLPNSGVTVSVSGEFLPDHAGVNVLNLRNASYANRDFWAVQATKAWINFAFTTNFDVGAIEIYNRGDEASLQSPKDITITAYGANYDNTYTLSATRPSDASGASTTHNLADAVYASFVKRGILAKFPRKDQVDGGAYRLTGVVTSNGIPASRRVRLFDQISGRLMRETWSDSVTGVYIFDYIRQGTFFVIAHDHTGAFDPEAKADLVAEAM